MNDKQKRLQNKVAELTKQQPDQLRFCDYMFSKSDMDVAYQWLMRLLADEPGKELKNYTLPELSELVHDMAKEKGWWTGERPWYEIACLIHSEISEAVECYRNGDMAMHLVDGKPEGLVVELADVLIRCLDAASNYCVELSEMTVYEFTQAPQKPKIPMLKWLNQMHVALAYEGSHDRALIECLELVAACAKSFHLDLMAALVAKIEYNATRPYRHGGKKA